ncbi:ABC transporter permease subunit [Treponema sp. HNW]|uniref:ABC transporter permease n=1 Tax=Treponema sp. HNW TaxID=3116654 RepID=UPI003D152802
MTVQKSGVLETLNGIFISAVLPAAVLVFIWQVQSLRLGLTLVLPSPSEVFRRIGVLIADPRFWQHAGATAFRSVYSFFISLVLSIVLGTLAGLFPRFRDFIGFPMGIIKASPVVSFILLAVFWFSTDTVPVFIGLLMTLPIMSASCASGIRETDQKILAMARIYGFTVIQKIRYIYVPSVLPYFLSGALTAFSLSWKVVAAAEVICLPKKGIGTAMQTAKTHIETADVFAYTIAIIVLSYLCERALGMIFNRRKKR